MGSPKKVRAQQAGNYTLPINYSRPSKPRTLTQLQNKLWKQFIEPAVWLNWFDTSACVCWVKIYSQIQDDPEPSAYLYSQVNKASCALYLNPESRDRASVKLTFKDIDPQVDTDDEI